MTTRNALSNRLAGALGAVLLGGLVACSHGGGDSASAVGSGTVILYSLDDMEGDWIGSLVPDNPTKPRRNFFIRVTGGQLVEGADSARSEWAPNDSLLSMSISQDGDVEASLSSLVFVNTLEISGVMDFDKDSISGTYDYAGPALLESQGTFELRRSSGPGHFDLDVIAGLWDGYGYNVLSNTRDLELELDATGAVIGGKFTRDDGSTVHSYLPGSGSFAYFDDAVGRFQDVVLVADDGTITTFQHMLVDEDGTLWGGYGHDSKLGSGVVELWRP